MYPILYNESVEQPRIERNGQMSYRDSQWAVVPRSKYSVNSTYESFRERKPHECNEHVHEYRHFTKMFKQLYTSVNT